MKKLKYHLKALFYGYQSRSTLLDGFKLQAIPVNYPKCLVLGVLREQRLKIWNVAAKTTHPDLFFKSHAQWMCHVQVERANLISRIAAAEFNEKHTDAVNYIKGCKIESAVYYHEVNT